MTASRSASAGMSGPLGPRIVKAMVKNMSRTRPLIFSVVSLEEGENLADLGGINIAYEAFKKTKQGKSNDKTDGFTPDQRFFLSWAQIWRENIRDQEMATRLKTDGHAPGMLRCNVPVSNMAAWYKAFNIKTTDKMYRPENERARVW